MHSKISQAQYETALTHCSQAAFKVRATKGGEEEEAPEVEESKFDSKGLLYGRVDLESDNMAMGSIKHSMEYRFMLLRHWTLKNAMLHSNYVSTRLKLWS